MKNIYFLILVVVFAACEKEKEDPLKETTISGVVTDSLSSSPVADVEVTLFYEEYDKDNILALPLPSVKTIVDKQKTDASGNFNFAHKAKKGKYTLLFEKANYEELMTGRDNQKVEWGTATALNLQLKRLSYSTYIKFGICDLTDELTEMDTTEVTLFLTTLATDSNFSICRFKGKLKDLFGCTDLISVKNYDNTITIQQELRLDDKNLFQKCTIVKPGIGDTILFTPCMFQASDSYKEGSLHVCDTL